MVLSRQLRYHARSAIALLGCISAIDVLRPQAGLIFAKIIPCLAPMPGYRRQRTYGI